MSMITDPDDFFARGCGRCDRFDTPDCSARLHAPALAALRALCREAGLTETAKWGHPCYMHAGRNVALFGAFRTDVRLSFFEAALLDDPEGLLQPKGPNSRTAGTLMLRDADHVAELAPALRALLDQGKANAAAGLRAPRVVTEIELPDELTAVLDDDPELAEGFAALTPGRQRSYVIALSSAKTSATRTARVLRARERILSGKGANER